jgi:hypothetical protein
VTTERDDIRIVIENPVSSDSTGASRGHNVGLSASSAQIEAFTEGRGDVHARNEDGVFSVTVRLPATVPTATASEA